MRGDPVGPSPPERREILGKSGEGDIERVAAWNDHRIDACAAAHMLPEHLSNQAFSPIPLDRATHFPRRHDAEPGRGPAVRNQQQGEVAPVEPGSALEDVLELGAAPDPAVFRELLGRRAVALAADAAQEDDTVRRLRPLARRLFNTRRPFLVAIRTRNPCVRRRRRVLGWKVRLPLAMIVGTPVTHEEMQRKPR
jgi:hypothetical protein